MNTPANLSPRALRSLKLWLKKTRANITIAVLMGLTDTQVPMLLSLGS